MSDPPRPPPRRLLGAPWRRASYASLDFETTGLDPGHDDIVSFGVVPIVGGRILFGERAYEEVSPAAALTARTIVVHGLRPRDVVDAPTLDEARGTLAGALDGRVLLAWAAEVESGFLAMTFAGSPRRWRRRIVDVLGLARMVDRLDHRDPGRGGYSLTAAAERWGVPVERPHHALDDALTTAQLFLVLASRLGGSTRNLLRAGRRGRR